MGQIQQDRLWELLAKPRSPEQERAAIEEGARKAERIKRAARNSPLVRSIERLQEALRRGY